MKLTAAAALGALILAASAAPAIAGGYWDGGIVQSGPSEGPPPGYAGRDCPCYCPPAGEGYGDQRDDRRGWSEEQDYDSGWRDDGARYDDQDEEGDYAPADYSYSGYDVGPEYVIDAGGGGAGFVGAGGFAGGGVDFVFGDRFRDHFHDQDHFRFRDHDHDMHHDHYPPHMVRRDDHPYPQHSGNPHMGSWGSMQSHPTHMIGSYGHTGGYGHPAMHGGGRR